MQRSPLPTEDGVRYRIYKSGNNKPENLLDFVEILQKELKAADVLPENYGFER